MDTGVGLVKAYLELCGYFVLAELPMRKSMGPGYRDVTDIDIIAVRFPHPSVADAAAASSPLDLLLGSDPELRTFVQGVDVIIGEVKEGRAELNPALHRQETIEFALRRLGCCPPQEIPDQAAAIVRMGAQEMRMDGMACRIRLVLFAGHGTDSPTDLVTVPLTRCVGFIEDRMRLAPGVMAGTQWKDSTLAVFALMAKLRARGPTASQLSGTPESTTQPGTLSS